MKTREMAGTLFRVVALAGLMAQAGCASTRSYEGTGVMGDSVMAMEPIPAPIPPEGSVSLRTDRKLIWTARLTVLVREVETALARVEAMVEQQGGYIERRTDGGERSAWLTLRIPATSFDEAVGALETLGQVTDRSVDSRDVTEEYVDIAARVENLKQLRARLLELIEKATEVQDILAIERELGRIQGETDALEARLRSLAARVDHATITLSLERKPVPGPLAYAFKGLTWAVDKLFFLRR